ncbi:MAG: rRNA maturation RNase YbeY [Gammaproteobacteria bacterium]|nr:rRNA maturation RNase YbeY [Gammaproteobacteria bacterium]
MSPRPRLEIAVQKTLRRAGLPTAVELRRWVRAAAGDAGGEVTVRIVGEDESAELNSRYRARSGPTNVLAFPAAAELLGGPGGDEGLPPAGGDEDLPPLGDVVVCAPVVEREAAEQGKTPAAHWAHIVIHGTLHLVGYDHENRADARIMEDRERALLAGFGFDDPYSMPGQ